MDLKELIISKIRTKQYFIGIARATERYPEREFLNLKLNRREFSKFRLGQEFEIGNAVLAVLYMNPTKLVIGLSEVQPKESQILPKLGIGRE